MFSLSVVLLCLVTRQNLQPKLENFVMYTIMVVLTQNCKAPLKEKKHISNVDRISHVICTEYDGHPAVSSVNSGCSFEFFSHGL